MLTENPKDLWWILDLKINVSKSNVVALGKEKEWTISVHIKYKQWKLEQVEELNLGIVFTKDGKMDGKNSIWVNAVRTV